MNSALFAFHCFLKYYLELGLGPRDMPYPTELPTLDERERFFSFLRTSRLIGLGCCLMFTRLFVVDHWPTEEQGAHIKVVYIFPSLFIQDDVKMT